MPALEWASKRFSEPDPASLHLDSLVFPGGEGYPHVETENRIILGDNLGVMAAIVADNAGKFDLIYADPPFFTNRRFPARIGRGEDSRRPKEWQLAEGYQDAWDNIEAYLDMLYPRLVLMHRLLSAQGSLYLHLDWHANAYARILLDEIFGAENLINEIVWLYHGPSPIRRAFNRKHDIILAYSKSRDYIFNVDDVRQPYNPSTVRTFGSSAKAGFGKVPDLERGKVPEDWWYFPVVARLHSERTGYPTQKPEALLERIILAASHEGSLVGDFFCGSGTTALVAGRLGRRFIASDSAWRAIQTTQARLVQAASQPFRVEVERGRMSEKLITHPAQTGIIQAHLQLDRVVVQLAGEACSNMEYWEVDPAWDGEVFRSAAQVVRKRKEAVITDKISFALPNEKNPLCVRLISNTGEMVQQVLNIQAITGSP
jgi:DNA modification methylase